MRSPCLPGAPVLVLLLACSTPPPSAARPEPCPRCPDALPAWQLDVLRPLIQELDRGIQLFGERGFGVCRGAGRCDDFLGTDPGELPPGDYTLRAELAVPSAGAPWQVRFSSRCTITSAGGAVTPQEYSRTYTVRPSGPDRGYRLDPLWKLRSPHPAGARSCQVELVPLRPDGAEGASWTASFSTPAPP